MKKTNGYGQDLAVLDQLIEEITVDAYGDDEQFWAFRQVIEDEVSFPCDGFVIGEPVSVVEIDYDGNERRGLDVVGGEAPLMWKGLKRIRNEKLFPLTSGFFRIVASARCTLRHSML